MHLRSWMMRNIDESCFKFLSFLLENEIEACKTLCLKHLDHFLINQTKGQHIRLGSNFFSLVRSIIL